MKRYFDNKLTRDEIYVCKFIFLILQIMSKKHSYTLKTINSQLASIGDSR